MDGRRHAGLVNITRTPQRLCVAGSFTPGPFQLSVYATSPSQGIAFREYFEQQGAPTGLVGLPDGMTRLTTVSFTRDQ
jgi:hypothetical protein